MQLPIYANLAIFIVAAIFVWRSGAGLSRLADVIAERTGLGYAFVGVLLLGVGTSLPEIVTTATASLGGNAALAGHNLLGGVAMQIAVLALIDATAMGRSAPLTYFSPRSVLLIQGVALVLLAALAIAAIALGDVAVMGHVGLGPIALAAVYGLSLYVVWRYEGQPRWEPSGDIAEPPQSAVDMKDEQQRRYAAVGLGGIWVRLAMAAAVVLVSGYAVAVSGEAIAEQTGVGSTVVGGTLVAFATSLPEISTTVTAVRLGAYSMAIANIFGTNAIELALFLPADLLYRDGLVLSELGRPAIFLAAMGIVTTTIYLWGILERRDRTAFGMGYDSIAVAVVYLVGVALFALSG